MRKRIGGYTDLGSIQIPPTPQPLILTDRADGTQWLLSFNTSPETDDTYGYISVNSDTAITRRESAKIFTIDEGPKFGAEGEFTLFIRSGRIGIDYTPFDVGIEDRDDAPIYARKRGNNRITRQLYMVNFEQLTNVHLAWTPDEVQHD